MKIPGENQKIRLFKSIFTSGVLLFLLSSIWSPFSPIKSYSIAQESEEDFEFEEEGDDIEFAEDSDNENDGEDAIDESFEDDETYALPKSIKPPPGIKPQIEVNAFPLKVVRKSQSTRVYLFEDPEGGIVQERNVFLIRKDAENVMAFRALKLYPDLAQFAARHVRLYPKWKFLKSKQEFMAIDKIGEFFPEPTPEEQVQDEEDLQDIETQMEANAPPQEDLFQENEDLPPQDELTKNETQDELLEDETEDEIGEGDTKGEEENETVKEELAGMDPPEINTYDEELDEGTSPPPGSITSQEGFAKEQIELSNLIVNEIYPLEKDKNWVSLGFGYFSAATLTGTTAFFSGVGLRYGYNIGDHLFVYHKNLQDSFTLEFGTFMYTITGFEGGNDTYTIAPIVGTARYNLYFADSLIVFAYAGILKNFVLNSSGGSDNSIEALSSFKPTIGAGLFIHIGPKWYVRFEVGLDFVGSGLVLKI